ncbi:MAG: family N-acetyltransferase [Acidimicrobiia bacterium]|nr:family N-acetyltransferase [Acidimicrobiia bacterium]
MEPLLAGAFALRLPERHDVVWLCDSCRDPEVSQWTRLPVPYRPRHAIEFVEAAHQRAERGTDIALLIEVIDSGELLGACGLMNIGLHRADIGYWLSPDGRGRGAATVAVRRLAELAQSTGLRALEAEVFVGNVRSERVLQRCGFVCVDADAVCDQRGRNRPATRWERRLP